MKVSKKMMPVLLILVGSIWGTVAYKVYASLHDENDENGLDQIPVEHTSTRPIETYKYVKDVRDPFRYAREIHKDSLKKKVTSPPKPVWTPPPFKLSGILVDNNKRTAMVEGTGGTMYFLQEGDTLAGLKVMKIRDKSVTYFYQKKKVDWQLEPQQN